MEVVVISKKQKTVDGYLDYLPNCSFDPIKTKVKVIKKDVSRTMKEQIRQWVSYDLVHKEEAIKKEVEKWMQ